MSREVLSAAVDDAATAAEWDALLEAMDRDPELKAEWSRLWAQRDARQGVQLQNRPLDLSAAVMAALQKEPAPSGKVVDLAGRRAERRPAPPRRYLRALVPLSAAAGVAAAAVFVGRPLSPVPVIDVAAVQPAPPEAGQVQPITATSAAALNDYLMEHSSTVAERSMGGAISSARFVVQTTAYPADAE